jgi:hypothetical protein
MSSNILSLPLPYKTIIDEAVVTALRLKSEIKNKEKSLNSISNHVQSNTLPKSIKLKLALIIPKNVSEDATKAGQAEALRLSFEESLTTFQRGAVEKMQTIAKYAVDIAKQSHLDFLTSVEKKIIDFYYRFLLKMDPAIATSFKNDMANYPTLDANDSWSDDVTEVLSYIDAWKKSYLTALKNQCNNEVALDIKNEQKIQTKDAAMDIVAGDANNLLVSELIQHKLQPIKKALKNLNKSKVEKSNSTSAKRNKDSDQSSNVSWDPSVPRPADGKDGKLGKGKKRRREEGNLPVQLQERKGRDKRQRSVTPDRNLRSNSTPNRRSRSSTPEGKPKSILKPSTSVDRHGRTPSSSSHSTQSRK